MKKTLLLISILSSLNISAETYRMVVSSNHITANSIVVKDTDGNEVEEPQPDPEPTVYNSCSELLQNEPATTTGNYTLNLGGTQYNVECIIESGEAWTAITPELAYDLNGGTINQQQSNPNASGFDNKRPYTAAINITYHTEYNIPLSFNFTQFKFDNYTMKGAADKYNNGSGSWDIGSSGRFTSWGSPNSAWGDIGIGSPSDSAPAFSFFAEFGQDQTLRNQEKSVPTTKVFNVSNGNVLRIAWNQGGGEIEGIFPFWSGKILVK